MIRQESPERVVSQIEELQKKYNCKMIFFGDEVFTVDRKRVVDICESLIEKGLNKVINWNCTTHINCIDEELAKIMRKAGCIGVVLGLETGDPEKLKEISKGTTVEKILSAVSELKRAKLPILAAFILGQPNETESSAKQTIDLAVKVNAHSTAIGIMVPYPGTAVGTMAEKGEGGYLLTATNWNDYNKQMGDALQFTGVSRKTLEKLQFTGILKVFIKNGRIGSLIKFCWSYRNIGFKVLRKLIRKDSTKSSA